MLGGTLTISIFDRHHAGVVWLEVVRGEGGAVIALDVAYANHAASELLGSERLAGRRVGAEESAPHERALFEACRAAFGSDSGSARPTCPLRFEVALEGEHAIVFVTKPPELLARVEALEERLRESEARFVQFMNNCPAAAYIKDENGRYLWVNAVLGQLYARASGKLEAESDHDLFSPHEIADVRANDRAVLESGETTSFIESVTVAGEQRHYLSYKFPIEDRRTGKRLLGGMSVDVSEQLRDREDRKRAEAALANIAQERLRLIDELREADRRKDDFLATLAHELRNPLAPIRNAVHIQKARGSVDPKLAWSSDVIDRQVRHMARLLDDLLDISRVSREKLVLRHERTAIAEVIDAALETGRPFVEASRHRLALVMPTEPLYVDADPVRLAQVFSNLLVNAAKYTPDEGTVSLTVQREGEELVVCVTDDGIGISADVLPTVFDMFSQAKPALVRAQGGLGIGLSLVKGLVELHGGRVHAASEGPNRGSTFTVRLPLCAPASVPAVSDTTPPESGGHRILVVDDNIDNADSLAALLELMGSVVMTAYDGEQALVTAETFRPTVVLLDLGMPHVSGYDVCRRLRGLPWASKLRVVAMTGWGQAEDRKRTREAGFDHHMVKPVDGAALAELLAAEARRASS